MRRLFYLCSLLCILVPLIFSSCTKPISTLNLVPVWTRVGDSQGVVDEEHDIASVESAEFSPDGTLIASGAKKGREVRVWDTATGAMLWEQKHDQEVEVVAFTRDGRYLATGGENIKVECRAHCGAFQNNVGPRQRPAGLGIPYDAKDFAGSGCSYSCPESNDKS